MMSLDHLWGDSRENIPRHRPAPGIVGAAPERVEVDWLGALCAQLRPPFATALDANADCEVADVGLAAEGRAYWVTFVS